MLGLVQIEVQILTSKLSMSRPRLATFFPSCLGENSSGIRGRGGNISRSQFKSVAIFNPMYAALFMPKIIFSVQSVCSVGLAVVMGSMEGLGS